MRPTIRRARCTRSGSNKPFLAALLALLFLGLAPAALASSQINLILPQSTAYAILGHSCGGIKEQSSPAGFNAVAPGSWSGRTRPIRLSYPTADAAHSAAGSQAGGNDPDGRADEADQGLGEIALRDAVIPVRRRLASCW